MISNNCNGCTHFSADEAGKAKRHEEFMSKDSDGQAKMLSRLNEKEREYFKKHHMRPGGGICTRFPKAEEVSELYCCGEFKESAAFGFADHAPAQEPVKPEVKLEDVAGKPKADRKVRAKKPRAVPKK